MSEITNLDESVIPPEIKDILFCLFSEISSLKLEWETYLGLYGEEKITSILSKIGCTVFNVIAESLVNDITMRICRLRDPKQSYKRDNLSFKKVQELTSISGDESFNNKLNNLIKEFDCKSSSIKDIRNRRVSHNDFNTLLHPQENPFLGIYRNQIDTLFQLASDILNTVSSFYHSGLFDTEHIVVDYGGVESFVDWLTKADKLLPDDSDNP